MQNDPTDISQWNKYSSLYDKGKGQNGDDLHNNLIQPTLTKFIDNVSKKIILDAGCGNGFLENQLAKDAEDVIAIDSSTELLNFAKSNVKQDNVQFQLGDLTKKLDLKDNYFDLVISNMVLQYLPNLEIFAKEASRILKKNGFLIMFVDHPSHALFLRAQELVGKKNEKFLNSDSYFKLGLRKKNSLWDKAVLQYYHRTISDYLNVFSGLFQLAEMQEISDDGETPRILGVKWRKALT
jgi:SAM-dependent methyltransferase